MELFEFASQIATPGYVAEKIASCEMDIAGCQIAVGIELSIIVVCIIAVFAARSLCKDKDDFEIVLFIALVIAVASAFAMLMSLMCIGYGYQELAVWSNDPVTKVVKDLADAL
ncbi:hypothetical protein [Gordonibacter urolithinfaciens]|uniref:hypothetical protein n=1 Tax=Gordonibacter urolithinfaciens TaxID=1335613 RepID=UPI001D05E5CC|nr:hypothetical protein [Gordonibacter urolithinfaciens]MCB7085760.1 hypothetical protein [Gordonibacter urolithinfaciens]